LTLNPNEGFETASTHFICESTKKRLRKEKMNMSELTPEMIAAMESRVENFGKEYRS
jgi:hypothetical protein